MNKNINGYCPSCNANFDGDLVIDTFIKQGKSAEDAISWAKDYAGWTKHGILNRWSRRISLSSIREDRIIGHRCPDCGHEW